MDHIVCHWCVSNFFTNGALLVLFLLLMNDAWSDLKLCICFFVALELGLSVPR